MKRTALVTGANRGIGLAIATGLAAQGLNVLMGCRNVDMIKSEAAKIKANAVQLNLSDRVKLADDLATILTRFPQIDVLVNNAGILENGSMMDVNMDTFYLSMRVNFEAPYELIHNLAPQMIKRSYGRIVNLSSGWGSFSDGLNGPAAYSVSKAALKRLDTQLFSNHVK